MKLLLCILAISAAFQAFGQQQQVTAGLYFSRFQASQEFRQQITRHPIGGAIVVLYSPDSSRWHYGIELGIGLHSGKKYFYHTADVGRPDNIDYIYEENGFLYYHLVSRYMVLQSSQVLPYAELRFGASSFFSAIRTMEYSDVVEDRFQFDDTVLSGYAGVGISLDVGGIWGQAWRRKLMLDGGGGYLISSQATYRNSVKHIMISSFQEGQRTSGANAWHFKLGVNLVF